MTSADFCTLSITSRQWLLLSEHSVQTSLGTTRFFPSIYLPHLLYTIPCSYRASSCVADLPSCTAFYTVSVRQTRGLPMGSFPTSGFLQICSHLQHPCLRLYPSRYQVDSGLSPVRNVRPPGAPTKAPVRNSSGQAGKIMGFMCSFRSTSYISCRFRMGRDHLGKSSCPCARYRTPSGTYTVPCAYPV